MRLIIDPAFRHHGLEFTDEMFVSDFPDGEARIQLPNLKDEVVYVIADMSNDASLARWLLALSGMVEKRPARIHLMIPFYPYSTMERVNGWDADIATAKHVAGLIKRVLDACDYTLSFCELHSPIIKGFFNDIFVSNVSIFEIDMFPTYCAMVEQILKLIGVSLYECAKNVVFGSVDASRGHILERLRDHFRINAPVVTIHKERISPTHTRIKSWEGGVHKQHVIIFDDMLRTGTSAERAALEYSKGGALSVSILATHNRMCGSCTSRLIDHFRYAYVTDTVPPATRDPIPRTSNIVVQPISTALKDHIVKLMRWEAKQ